MTIRFTLIDRTTGQSKSVDAPRRGEHVKNGQTHLLPANKDACDNLRAAIKGVTKLGLRGGVLA